MPWICAIINVYKILHMQHETKQITRQFNWKVKFNWWNNCLLQRWICYRYYRYSPQNHFTGSTKVFLNQSLHFLINQPIMWNHDILDLRKSFDLQVKKLWQNSLFTGSNTKACKRVLIFFGKSHVSKTYTWFSTIY